MTNEPMKFTCAQFDDTLSEYLEETLGALSRGRVDAHLAGCLRCSAILRDINTIRSEASALPELFPSRDLWAGIAARIEPAVLPLGGRVPRGLGRRWVPVAAAAALVIATAGVTYVATTRSLRPVPGRVATAVAPRAAPTSVPGVGAVVTAESPAPDVQAASSTESSEKAESRRPVNTSSGTAVLASRRIAAPATSSELAYGEEIQRLQKVITDRRRELDPATVNIVEQNLKIIDAAVKQSRAALARDPRSGFLADQLNNALEKKVDLLRTVALLPSST